MILRATIACLLAAPAAAQSPEPGLDEAMAEFARKAREALAALEGAVEPWLGPLELYLADPDGYLPPEVTPEGDIIIRRRPDAPPADGPAIDL